MSDDHPLLNRKCRVTVDVGNPLPGQWFQQPVGTGFQPQIVIENLRVNFTTEKHLGKHPNEAKITISNLKEGTRKALQFRPLKVTLETAYGDNPYAVIFRGDVRLVDSEHDRTDWLTKIQLGDGERAYANATISKSFRGAVSGKEALSAAAQTMGLHVPKSVEDARSMVSNIANNGLSLHGPSHSAMSTILDPQGMSWSIQDGQLQILTEDQVIDANGVITSGGSSAPAIVLSQETGMLGVPDFSAPKNLGKPPILKVKALINAQYVPGKLLQVKSRGVNGNFRIEDVKTSGDTHNNEWHSEITAKQL